MGVCMRIYNYMGNAYRYNMYNTYYLRACTIYINRTHIRLFIGFVTRFARAFTLIDFAARYAMAFTLIDFAARYAMAFF